jgi:DNA-damage-inducible protein J
MAKTSNLNMRIDPKTKDQAEQIFSALGITVTDAVNMFLHQAIIYGGIPFDLKVERPNIITVSAMKEAELIAEAKAPRFKTAADMFKDLGI